MRRRVTGLILTLILRKPGERTGLDTPVVLALNDGHLVCRVFQSRRAGANALSVPPGEYGRKAETQRN